ncbi:MAG: phosphoribosyltransferase family protein [Patescibacteria group bacterium]
MFFYDRREAGIKLAEKLVKFRDRKDAVVLGLPRGGVVVAAEVAKKLNIEMDIVVPRKITAPDNPEYAIGAICYDDVIILNESEIKNLGIPKEYLNREIKEEKEEMKRRQKLYRGQKPPLVLKNRIVILVDDGIATGLTMLAAVNYVLKKEPRVVIIAVPVGAQDSIHRFEEIQQINEVICLYQPAFFGAVGAFYQIFEQTTDEEVIELMAVR